MPKIPIALCLLTLCSCSKAVLPQPILAPADLTQACDTLPVFGGKTMLDLVDYTSDLQGSYQECSLRHKTLSEFTQNP